MFRNTPALHATKNTHHEGAVEILVVARGPRGVVALADGGRRRRRPLVGVVDVVERDARLGGEVERRRRDAGRRRRRVDARLPAPRQLGRRGREAPQSAPRGLGLAQRRVALRAGAAAVDVELPRAFLEDRVDLRRRDRAPSGRSGLERRRKFDH